MVFCEKPKGFLIFFTSVKDFKEKLSWEYPPYPTKHEIVHIIRLKVVISALWIRIHKIGFFT